MQNILTIFKRIVKSGVNNFIRNGWLSTATVSVLSITLFMILGLILVSVATETLIGDLKSRVDVSVYFKKDAKEPDILSMKNDVLALAEVKSATYISEDDALLEFREKHSGNEIIIQSLDALEDNPLEASLNIKAKDPSQFGSIVATLEKEQYKGIVSKINYYENKGIIDKLGVLISTIRKVGFGISAVLVVIALLVAFNTIRITIYTMREEIGVMKLVGASNWFVRGPFIVEGLLYGLTSSVATILLALPVILFSSPYIKSFFPGVDLISYFTSNLLQVWLILFVISGMIGSLGSLIAMQKYLKV
ncbi:ABC transporter permease [Candidatus Azambacteria bacterium]|nr:ABC transporter permease [Candidatus Azambacteria bacterium]